MYSFRSLALLAASSLIANVTLTAAKIQGEVAPKVPGAYIVELQDDQVGDMRKGRGELDDAFVLNLIVAEVELVAKVVLRWYLLQPLRPTAEREVEAAVAAAAMQ